MWEPHGLPLRKIGANWLVHTHSRCATSKGSNNHQRPSTSRIARFRVTHRFRPTRKWNNCDHNSHRWQHRSRLPSFLSFFPPLALKSQRIHRSWKETHTTHDVPASCLVCMGGIIKGKAAMRQRLPLVRGCCLKVPKRGRHGRNPFRSKEVYEWVSDVS